jgi:hypothetical protein
VRYVAAFGSFWWNFVVGDDWTAAAGIVVAIGATGALAASDIAVWWVMPLAVVVVLYVSLRRAVSASG